MSRYTQANRAKWRAQCRDRSTWSAYGNDWGAAGKKPQTKKSPAEAKRSAGKPNHEGGKRSGSKIPV